MATIKSFKELGRQAFNNGQSANPYANAEFMKLKAQSPEVGGAIKHAKAFAKGWHEANAHAPVN